MRTSPSARSKPATARPRRRTRSAIARADPARRPGDERDATLAAAWAQYRPPVGPWAPSTWRSSARGTRASPSPTSTARSSSTAACSASSCASRRLYEEREIAEIVGVPEATAWDIAFLRIPGSDVEIELLEYKGCERRSGARRPCDYGSGHFALHRRRHRGAVRRPRRRAASCFRSDGPGRAGRGPATRRQEPLRARPGRLHHRVQPAAAAHEHRHRRRGSRSTGRWR